MGVQRIVRKLKQLLLCGLAVSLSASSVFPMRVFAAEPWPSDCYVSAEGACVIDADSGAILYGKNAHEAYFPASITKVMTALLVLEHCENLEEIVSFSYDSVVLEDNATNIGASAGDQLSVRDCLYSLLLKSANEVANALAEHVGAKYPERKEAGMTDRDVFVRMMNEKAEALGCTDTNFNNPSGLTDPEHRTSAYDMCLIMAAAIKNERFREIESRTYWTHAPIKRYPDPKDPWNTVYQSHRMIRKNSYYYYPGTIAGKTGFTTNAGNTLVTACERNGMTLVATVLNGHMTHYEDTTRLFDFGYRNFQSIEVKDYDSDYQSVQNDLSVFGLPLLDRLALVPDENSRVTLPKEESFASVSSEIDYQMTEHDPPDAVAKIRYYYDGERPVGTSYLRKKEIGMDAELRAIEEDPLLLSLTEEEAPEVLSEETASEPAGTLSGEQTPEDRGAEKSAGAEDGIREEELPEAEKDLLFGISVPPFAKTVLKILGAVFGILLLSGIWMLHNEKKEAQQRARWRQQRLKHTKDLTGQQNIKMDLMVQQRLRNGRKRGRKR